MTTYLLAGGGTAGHVNPLLATADELRRREPDASIIVVGTAEGLEARLVPLRGYELVVIPRLPFPRRPGKAAVAFLPRLRGVIAQLRSLIAERSVDVVVGFGGYAAAPAYLAARRSHVPIVIHEANARPGLANRLGARFTPYVGVVFAGTPLPHAVLTGLPLRSEIATLDMSAASGPARQNFGLDSAAPVLLVTGGSLGAQRLNHTIRDAFGVILDAGWQILHIWGDKPDIVDPGVDGYVVVKYSDRMDLAFASADLVVARAGAATVSELAVLGLPSILVPYPVGNGEQKVNAHDLVEAGAAVLVDDARFTSSFVAGELSQLLADRSRIDAMAHAARQVGIADGDARLADLIQRAVARA
ncbi:UDP-N-acetylglucosamine-N-acetylmuramylpentapeptide N-acetylglucosamine transferase [Agreia bicolorata]|uniref:UDP-N-acetylglucosamine--N-acetylmuramyl-(pentapeptide) pyrophosphoryl-undecaprenol N-acetylglucosamine transferase n=1 Tax=Agreia bicolorata TaxID=110935 RepID=A0A1T4YBM0_9MICO|nr:UDP-N-acetylglucosamine--N-acetylmuramyl-(pentapeptide) pyrophosphoryl-undecaprenol N-acetylglucosamine transferase [Agreia bicolorata]KJC63191.1 UDP-diphospho-muramoylpentapeptide beta-N-acetylglucosaminyltransferase [Agreia bicolorata]SKA99169.1 UDP-N-acetylglucosamine-N-acetylmuramylpentapeptide N-acetylglucosamine transferase [Agreia bicolorata]